MSRKKRSLGWILIACSVTALIALSLFLFSRLESRLAGTPENADTAPTLSALRSAEESSAAEDEARRIISYEGRQYQYNDDISVLLILGIDDYGVTESKSYRNTSQADFLMLGIFNDADRTVTLLQLNRDTMTNVPVLDARGELYGLTREQLALAHTYGSGLEDSCENTAYAVSLLLYGLPIDNYLAVTMNAIPVLNDLVGGVTVTIEDNFAGVDDTLRPGSTVTLTGAQAETFVRARSDMPDDPTNIARMRRQRVYMAALEKALRDAAAADSSFVLNAYAAMAGDLLTDCTIDELNGYAEQLAGSTLSEILTPEGESVRGENLMEFYVDEAALQQLIIDLFYLPLDG